MRIKGPISIYDSGNALLRSGLGELEKPSLQVAAEGSACSKAAEPPGFRQSVCLLCVSQVQGAESARLYYMESD